VRLTLVAVFCAVLSDATTRPIRSQGTPRPEETIVLWGVEPTYTKPSTPPPSDAQFVSAVRAGVSWIQTYGGVKIENRDDSVTAFLDRMLALRFRVIASVEHISGGRLDTAFISRKIRRWVGHPAIGAWELVDEPEIKAISPADLHRAYSLCKQLDPARAVMIVWAPVSHKLHYESDGRTFDWGAIDVYPLGQERYDSAAIPRALGELLGTIPMSDRPLTPIVQTFEDSHHALPSTPTLRTMVQQFRAAGARAGVALYNWNADQGASNLGTTALWEELVKTSVASELNLDH
jgi:hypothetical protein